MRGLTGWTCAIALAIGCGKKTDNTASKAADKPSGSAATAAATGSGSAASEFDAHMKAGQAFEDQRKWPEALDEFRAAVGERDHDARALNELSFTAFWAGMPRIAQEAATTAAEVSKADKKVHGQALFNLGLSVEKKQPYAAQQLYIASLAERPNKGVAARLAKISKDKPETKQSKDDLALLDQVGVKAVAAPAASPAPAAPTSSTAGSKEDQALMAALEAAGVEWESGAGKSVLFIENVKCGWSGGHRDGRVAYSCSTPAVTGDVAARLVGALKAKKVAEAPSTSESATYSVSSIRCRSFNEGDSGQPDECEITP